MQRVRPLTRTGQLDNELRTRAVAIVGMLPSLSALWHDGTHSHVQSRPDHQRSRVKARNAESLEALSGSEAFVELEHGARERPFLRRFHGSGTSRD